MSDAPAVYLGLGANLGNRRRNIVMALRRMAPLVRVEAVSRLYESEPMGPEGQPPYYNAACRAVTGIEPKGLLRHLQEVEREIGRRPGVHWGPRPIDIDILLYGDRVLDEPGLRIPHPGLPERAFVLLPLRDVAADVTHPELGRAIADLAREIDASGVREVAGDGWDRLPPAVD